MWERESSLGDYLHYQDPAESGAGYTVCGSGTGETQAVPVWWGFPTKYTVWICPEGYEAGRATSVTDPRGNATGSLSPSFQVHIQTGYDPHRIK